MSKLTTYDPSKQPSKPWSTEETTKLLDLIEKHKENWDEIVINLASSRTREEIILHFLQLPLKNITNIKIFENGEDTEE